MVFIDRCERGRGIRFKRKESFKIRDCQLCEDVTRVPSAPGTAGADGVSASTESRGKSCTQAAG